MNKKLQSDSQTGDSLFFGLFLAIVIALIVGLVIASDVKSSSILELAGAYVLVGLPLLFLFVGCCYQHILRRVNELHQKMIEPEEDLTGSIRRNAESIFEVNLRWRSRVRSSSAFSVSLDARSAISGI